VALRRPHPKAWRSWSRSTTARQLDHLRVRREAPLSPSSPSGGHEVRVTTEEGRITAFQLASTGVELKRYGYTDGNLTAVTDSSGLPLRFTYDSAVASLCDGLQRPRYTYEYDEQAAARPRRLAGHMSLRNSPTTTRTRKPATG